jgi:phosphoglycolate phosphatase-like HAD superfamily hydrolase
MFSLLQRTITPRFISNLPIPSLYLPLSTIPFHRKMSTTTSSPHSKPIHWILDWDGTLTQKDTLNALVSIAAATKPTFPTHDRWKSVVDAYISDYTSTLASLTPNDNLPHTLAAESKLLKDLKPVEQRSLDRVSESKIFEGLTRDSLADGAKKAVQSGEVALRSGSVDFVQSISATNDRLHILSVNWSRHFIASCLEAAGINLDRDLIFANELAGIEEGEASTGEIRRKIIASDDKLRYLETMRDMGRGEVVYVGDSWTDIECLLAADVGICIRDEPRGSSQGKLAEAMERLGVSCVPLLGGAESQGSQVFWARDFVGILEWARGRGGRLK